MLRRAVLALLLLSPLALAHPSRTDVSGRYTSNWDEVTLVQKGDRVTGTYVCCGGGTINGRLIEGRVIRYRWDQPSGWGLGVWMIDGHQLLGTWGPGESSVSGGRWDLDRKSTQQVAR